MKRILLAIMIVMIAGQAWGATYYMVKATGGQFCVKQDSWPTATTDCAGETACSANDIEGCLTTVAANNTLVLSGGASGKTYVEGDLDADNFVQFTHAGQGLRGPISSDPDQATHGGAVTIDVTGSAAHILFTNGKANITISDLTLINAPANTYAVILDGNATVQRVRFRGNWRAIRCNAGTVSILNNDFQGEGTDATGADIFFNTGTPTATVSYNLFRPYGSVGGGTTYGYGPSIQIQGTGTYNIYNNVFAGTRTSAVSPFGTPSYTLNLKNNMIIGCGAQGSHTGGLVGATAGGTFTSTNNYFGINPVAPAAPETNADTSTSNLYGTSPANYTSSSRRGYITFSVDDYNAAYSSFAYIQSIAPYLVSNGMKLTWFIDVASALGQADYAANITWAKANNVEIGLHSRSHSDLSVADGLKIWDTSGNVTVDRAANTITTAGGTITPFKDKALSTIKTLLEGAPHSLTVTPVDAAYGGAEGKVGSAALGEVLKDSGPGTTVLIKVTDHTAGLLKSEIVDALATLEAIAGVGAGTVKSFAYPYGTSNAASKAAVRSAGLTSARKINIDANSSQHISNLDRYLLGCSNGDDADANTTSGDSTEDVKANTNGLMAYLAETGSIVTINAHQESEISAAHWATIFSEAAKWKGKVTATMSTSEAITDIMTFATDDGDGTLSYTWTEAPNYTPSPGSPAINAGVVVAGVHPGTDFAGNPNFKGAAPDIGAYEKSLGGLFQTFNKTNQFAPHRRLH